MTPDANRTPAPGTRPEGARNEAEAARTVREMFSRIAPRYDLLNHLLSFSLDRVWRWRTSRRFAHILARPGARVLDVCCGTGDLALALAKRARQEAGKQGGGEAGRQGSRRAGKAPGAALIVGADFAHPMLVRARQKAAVRGFDKERPDSMSGSQRAAVGRLTWPAVEVHFVESDALRLPFADAAFDLVTAAFGFRNLANYQQGLLELRRVLKPRGELGILEFSDPHGFFAPFYRFYFTRLLPRIGGAVSGDAGAYSYLPASVEKFPRPEELSELLATSGFHEVHFRLFTAGAVALHTARKK